MFLDVGAAALACSVFIVVVLASRRHFFEASLLAASTCACALPLLSVEYSLAQNYDVALFIVAATIATFADRWHSSLAQISPRILVVLLAALVAYVSVLSGSAVVRGVLVLSFISIQQAFRGWPTVLLGVILALVPGSLDAVTFCFAIVITFVYAGVSVSKPTVEVMPPIFLHLTFLLLLMLSVVVFAISDFSGNGLASVPFSVRALPQIVASENLIYSVSLLAAAESAAISALAERALK